MDNDGNALITGAIYFNSVANTMRVYNGSSWQDQAASPDTIAERSFSATAGQTSYTFTGGYRVGYTYVYVNGALLAAADITATDGTTITFTSALSLNDEVRILSYKAIGSVAIGDISGLQTALDAKLALAGGTMSGAIAFAGGQTFPGTQATLVSGTNIKTINGSSVLGSGDITIGGSGYTVKVTNYTAVAGDNILANTSGGSFTITLPASPTTGAVVNIIDADGTFNINALTVARNGNTIMSIAEDMYASTNGATFGLVYNGSTWRII